MLEANLNFSLNSTGSKNERMKVWGDYTLLRCSLVQIGSELVNLRFIELKDHYFRAWRFSSRPFLNISNVFQHAGVVCIACFSFLRQGANFILKNNIQGNNNCVTRSFLFLRTLPCSNHLEGQK